MRGHYCSITRWNINDGSVLVDSNSMEEGIYYRTVIAWDGNRVKCLYCIQTILKGFNFSDTSLTLSQFSLQPSVPFKTMAKF